MMPAIEILNARGAELGLTQPWHFFWATGLLSSFLDNAPTYVVFFETAGALPIDPGTATLAVKTATGIISVPLLVAISCGAVFMGANTYIGNGPNFMVKSIAEQSGVKMPSFFGYMLYSVAVLVPLFIVVTLVFFRG
jgi:Na+/H+ antiporter NhaD/arsenite permease-like protein